MGFFDGLKRMAMSSLKSETSNMRNNTIQNLAKGRNRTETFTFSKLPGNVQELQALPEATLDSAFKTTALTLAVLCHYEKNSEETLAMLDFLKGPENVSTYEKQFIHERLYEKEYKPFSFFMGATPQNSYTPSQPYQITVSETPYSFDHENWATLYVKSGGADFPRSVKLRRKPSTGQWFLNEIQCLSDIRIPEEKDPWA